MTELESLYAKFSNCCFTLSKQDILDFDKNDNGPINNVIAGINLHCFGARLYDDEHGLTVEMFYVNNEKTLKGDLICLNINDPYYFELLLKFCSMLSEEYFKVDALDAFNTFQNKLRGFLEKLGFFTVTNLDLKQYEGQEVVMVSTSKRGIIKLDFIDKTQFYRDFFNNNYDQPVVDGNEYVYLMVNADTSLIKIGTSKKPKYRERTLHSQEPKVHLIALWCRGKEVERILHQKFSSQRVRGEWFRLTLNDLKEIENFMQLE